MNDERLNGWALQFRPDTHKDKDISVERVIRKKLHWASKQTRFCIVDTVAPAKGSQGASGPHLNFRRFDSRTEGAQLVTVGPHSENRAGATA